MSETDRQPAGQGLTPMERAVLSRGLLAAAFACDTASAERLLAQGADPGACHAETGLTPLHIAIGTNNLRLTRILVEGFRAPFVPDGEGRLPTVIAAECQASDELCDYVLLHEATSLGSNEEP